MASASASLRRPSSSSSSSSSSIALDLVQSRWMSLAASFFIMACNGTIYAFGIYSQTMKLTLGYNQEQLTTIGFFKDLGANVGIISGIMQDFTGAWPVIGVAAILNVAGSTMIWLGLTHRIAPPSVWQMSLYHFICFNATAFVNTAIVVTGIKNFPGNRGFVLGLLKGFFGLSGAIISQIYYAVYGDNPSSFVFLLLWLPTSVFLGFMFFIRRRPPTEQGNETRRFSFMLATSVFLASYLLIVILLQKLTKVTPVQNKILAAISAVILMSPLGVVLQSVLEDRKSARNWQSTASNDKTIATENVEAHGVDPPSLYASAPDQKVADQNNNNAANFQLSVVSLLHEQTVVSRFSSQNMRIFARSLFGGFGQKVSRGEDHTVLQAMLKLDFWLLFTISTCALGTGLMAIDNIGQLGAALRYSSLTTRTSVSLVSIWNFAGRVSSGFASEFCLKRYSIPRPVFYTLPLAMGGIGQLLFAFAVPGALTVGSILIGFAYGFQIPMVFIIISEIFGLSMFGTLYNIATMSLPLGTELLSVLVGGRLYDREAAKQYEQQQHRLISPAASSPTTAIAAGGGGGHHDHPGSPAAAGGKLAAFVCVGEQCFRNAFLIMAGVSAFGCILGIILTFRTRLFYKENAARLTKPPAAAEHDQRQNILQHH